MKIVTHYRFGERLDMEVPAGRVVLVACHVDLDTLPTVWVEHLQPAAKDAVPLHLRVIASDSDIPDIHVHVGSAVCAQGLRVWHVYDVAVPELALEAAS